MIKITVGNYEVLDKGTIVFRKKENVTFHLASDAIVSIGYKIEKHKLVSDSELHMRIEYPGNFKIVTQDVEVGILNNKKLYFRYRIPFLAFDQPSYIAVMHYTWYLGKEVIGSSANKLSLPENKKKV